MLDIVYNLVYSKLTLLFCHFSGYLWERVVGGQIQKPPCDEVSTNPLLVFSTNKPTTLLTVPLNLTTVR